MTDGVFGRRTGHEQVVYCQDVETKPRLSLAYTNALAGLYLGGAKGSSLVT